MFLIYITYRYNVSHITDPQCYVTDRKQGGKQANNTDSPFNSISQIKCLKTAEKANLFGKRFFVGHLES